MIVAQELQRKYCREVKKDHSLEEKGDELTGSFMSQFSISTPSMHIHEDVSFRVFDKQLTYHYLNYRKSASKAELLCESALSNLEVGRITMAKWAMR